MLFNINVLINSVLIVLPNLRKIMVSERLFMMLINCLHRTVYYYAKKNETIIFV